MPDDKQPPRGRPCEIDGTPPEDTPMVFKDEPWCSDHCRKVCIGETEPTPKEWASMTPKRFERLNFVWAEGRS